MNSKRRVFIIAGEPSGDLHGSMFIAALKGLSPVGVDFMGIGGPRMEAQGLKSVYPMERIAVVGLVEVITHGRDILRAYREVKKTLVEWRPDLVVFIDYPGFNLRMLSFASKIGLNTMYYITPQVWAWKKRRVKILREHCRAAAVILPFEEPFMKDHGVKARFVGHPLLDVVRPTTDARGFLLSIGLKPNIATIGLMPGSRKGEVKRHLPVMLECARAIRNEIGDVQFIMPMSQSGLLAEEDKRQMRSQSVHVVTGMTYDAMASCSCLVLASGTVTLEAAILGIPHVVMYRLSPVTYMLGRLLVDVPYISLTNIIAGERLVEEYIQGDATAENLKEAVVKLLEDGPRRSSLIGSLKRLRARLGEGGASFKAASLALELLGLA